MRFAVLLALALAAAAPAVATPLPFKPGTVTLAVPPAFESSLGIDFERFTPALCNGAPVKDGPTGRIDCGASVGDTKIDPIEALLLDFSGKPELAIARLEVLSLELSGLAPWQAPCGTFDLKVTLDPRAAQPVSTLTLIPEGTAPSGSFSGFLEAAVSLRFEATAGGRVVEIPTQIKIPMGGPYALADLSPEAGQGARSNVALLLRRNGDSWTRTASCASPPLDCPDFCLTASKKALDELQLSAPVALRREDGPQ